jgi:hypothetical protein
LSKIHCFASQRGAIVGAGNPATIMEVFLFLPHWTTEQLNWTPTSVNIIKHFSKFMIFLKQKPPLLFTASILAYSNVYEYDMALLEWSILQIGSFLTWKSSLSAENYSEEQTL